MTGPGRASRLTVGVALVVALVVGACGGSGGGGATEPVRAAADQTLAAGSARVALRLTYSAAAVTAEVSGEGIVDLKGRRGSFTLDLGSLAGLGLGGTVETVVDQSGIFVKAPAALRGSKPWLKVDLAALGSQLGIDIGALGGLQSADLGQTLSWLASGASKMAKVGKERVRDAETTHYRGALDLAQATAGLPPEARKPAEDAARALGTLVVPVDVWLDGAGRMRKVRLSVQSGGSATPTVGAVEFELYDFGVQADIAVPPPDQVTDLLATILGGGRR